MGPRSLAIATDGILMISTCDASGINWKLSAFNHEINEYRSVLLGGFDVLSTTLEHLQGVTIIGGAIYDFISIHFYHNSGTTLTKIKNIKIYEENYGGITFKDLSTFYSGS